MVNLPKVPNIRSPEDQIRFLREIERFYLDLINKIEDIESITWDQVDKTGSDLADLELRSHNSLTEKGTNTHTQIDSHIANSNIHSDITAYVTTTSDITLGNSNYLVDVDATLGAITITLPVANTLPGKTFQVKKVDSSTNNVNITSTSSVDGEATQVINKQYECITVMSNNSTWEIL